MEEEIFLKTRAGNEVADALRRRKKIIRAITKIILVLILVACSWRAYDDLWLRHRYLITAYCDCPICINVPEFRDGKFASRRPVYWGGVAADKSVPFGSRVDLVPVTVKDWLAVRRYLSDRKDFTVEDRGGMIRGRHIDIYFPPSIGGHEAALHWGARRMRIKINGKLAE